MENFYFKIDESKNYKGKCVICGDYFEDTAPVMLYEDTSNNPIQWEVVHGAVCADCIMAGKTGAVRRLVGHAETMVQYWDRLQKALEAMTDKTWNRMESAFVETIPVIEDHRIGKGQHESTSSRD